MSEGILHDESAKSPFDSIRRFTQDGKEYWTARELMKLLGYAKWERFGAKETQALRTSVVKKGYAACKNSGSAPEEHFTHFPTRGNVAEDWHLTRYACYLIAQNGDPEKSEIAMAQSYFATKTREAEAKIEVVAPVRALPTRDTIDYINAQAILDKRPRDRATALFEQMLHAEAYAKQNSLARSLPENVEIKHYTTAMIRASQLGYSVSQINGGAQLGKFVKQAIAPDHQDWQGQYLVWQYEVNETLDARIHAYFLTRAL